jgi:hypothetical protein
MSGRAGAGETTSLDFPARAACGGCDFDDSRDLTGEVKQELQELQNFLVGLRTGLRRHLCGNDFGR